jgi:hypothetical protein
MGGYRLEKMAPHWKMPVYSFRKYVLTRIGKTRGRS